MLVRIAPLALLLLAAAAWIVHVEGAQGYPARNVAPLVLVLAFAWLTLVRGRGVWTGAGWQWPLAVVGFAIPSIGLSLYLHYGYANDLDGMYSEAVYPQELFRYLPAYTLIAGVIGAAIGWRIGRNV